MFLFLPLKLLYLYLRSWHKLKTNNSEVFALLKFLFERFTTFLDASFVNASLFGTRLKESQVSKKMRNDIYYPKAAIAVKG